MPGKRKMQNSKDPPEHRSWPQWTDVVEGVPNALVAGVASPCVMTRPHWHAQVEVNFIFSGGVHYRMATHDVQLKGGQFALFWGGLPHQALSTLPGTNFVAIHLPLVHFFRLRFSSGFADQITRGATIVADTSGIGDVEAFSRMIEFMQSSDPLRREYGVTELLVRLGRLNFEPYHVIGDPTPVTSKRQATDALAYRGVVKICDYIVENFRNEIHSSDIAASVDMHPKYAMTMFKQSTGMSLLEYLTLLRMSCAQALLLDSSITILEVAMESGFGTVGAFSQAFKKLLGKSPSEYRRDARAVGEDERKRFGSPSYQHGGHSLS
jgi:AraC-like DNA-binding protein